METAVGYFEATDLDEAVDAFAEDVTFVFHGESRHLAGATTFTGKKAAGALLTDWFSRFAPGYRMEVATGANVSRWLRRTARRVAPAQYRSRGRPRRS